MRKVLSNKFLRYSKCIIFCCFSIILFCGCNVNGKIVEPQNTSINQTNPSDFCLFQDFYSPAFQLIWNDFSDTIVGRKIKFVDGNPQLVDNLNKRRLTENMLSENDYYKIIAPQTVKTKNDIESAIKHKFNEKSRLLDSISWREKDDGVTKVLYCMFKKNVAFPLEFDVLDADKFIGDKKSDQTYKMFGLKGKQNKYRNQVIPVYYNDENDYAVRLLTDTDDEIILLTSNSDEPILKIWDKFYKEKLSKNSYENFDSYSYLKVPFVNLSKIVDYVELEDKEIKNSSVVISKAIEAIDFKLDNKGAVLKNEALLSVDTARFVDKPKKEYYFNKPFVLFMRTKNDKTPYFSLKIQGSKYLQKI